MEKSSRNIAGKGKIKASVLLKLFINSHEIYTTDAPWHTRGSRHQLVTMGLFISERQMNVHLVKSSKMHINQPINVGTASVRILRGKLKNMK